MQVRNIELEIIQADITALDVDAIVNPAHPTLKMGGGLSAFIKKMGGAEIESQAVRKGPIEPGMAIATSAGSLKAKHVIHSVSVYKDLNADEKTIRLSTAKALDIANEMKLNSLAIPAMGCGIGRFPAKGAAKIIGQEILKFSRQKDLVLKKVIVCLFDEEMFQIFKKNVEGYIDYMLNRIEGPYVTVDAIIEMEEGIILIERSNPPFGWALPGGFVDYGESLEDAARREAKEETNMELENMKQFFTYSDPSRDPRFHTIATVFVARGKGVPQFGDDAQGLRVVAYDELLKLSYAFDHKKIIKEYLELRKELLGGEEAQ